ncbi:MAG TPA: hypothetical protein VFV65_02015 [Gemmatimonadales bacterium]|nr:hypothetical protein [Gemmatimonadales bacterium]
MFVGHYGLAFALKRAEPRHSLGTLFIAVQLVDIAWGATILLGWERVQIDPGWTAATPLRFLSYPITHSLLAAGLWAAVAASAWYTWPTRDTSRHGRAALILALAVASHWFLDAVVHVPDLPLAGDETRKVGLGLWNSIPLTFTVELALLGSGLALYLGGGSRKHAVRPVWAVGFTVVLAAAYIATTLGPPPPSVPAVGAGALVTLLLIALIGAWIDRARPPAPS